MELYLTTLSALTTIDLSSCSSMSKDRKLIIFSKENEVIEMTASSLASIIGAKNLTAEVVIINSEADIIFKLGYLSATKGKTDKIYSMLPDEINLSKEILGAAGVYTYSVEKKKRTPRGVKTKNDSKINTSFKETETNNKTSEHPKETEINTLSEESEANNKISTPKEVKTDTSSKKVESEANPDKNSYKESIEKIKKYLKNIVEPDKIDELALSVRDALAESIMMDDKMGALMCKGKIAKAYGKEVGNIIADKYRILKGQL